MGLVNESISWEDIYTYNSGLDVDMWDGLLGMEFDLFYRLRNGVLGTRTSTLPTTFGATFPQENINSIDNRGGELLLKHRNQIGKFNYSIGANVSWTREKYVKYAETNIYVLIRSVYIREPASGQTGSLVIKRQDFSKTRKK
jgi:hypothetical protein